MPYWAAALCGSETPSWLQTYIVRPEQSNPAGEAPPHTYGVPRYCIAIAAACPPSVLEGGIGTEPLPPPGGGGEAPPRTRCPRRRSQRTPPPRRPAPVPAAERRSGAGCQRRCSP